MMSVVKFICHSHYVTSLAVQSGWLPGARYTNLRDVRKFDRLGFLDIDWESYNFNMHLKAAKETSPLMTVARDITDIRDFDRVIHEAFELLEWADKVIVVPKDSRLEPLLPSALPDNLVLGYSVPTRYGSTTLPLRCFMEREVHLLGGHPAKQRRLADQLQVISIDCNRFTLDAAYGDYFDGETFRPHPVGGYDRCVSASIHNINLLWEDYCP